MLSQTRNFTFLLAILLVICSQITTTHGLAAPYASTNQLTLDGLKTLLQQQLNNDDQHDHDGPQSSKQSVLGSRLEKLNLDRTRLGESQVEVMDCDVGRGLFATMDCKKGDLLTCYPGDLLLVHSSSWSQQEQGCETLPEDEGDDYEDTFVWGSHVPQSYHHHKMTDDELWSEFSGYILQVTDSVAVVGLPWLDQDMAYAGHFANDGAAPPRCESHIASYLLESNEIANAMHISLLDGLHMVTVATRDIKKGDEILVTYGPEYWMDHILWNSNDDDYNSPYQREHNHHQYSLLDDDDIASLKQKRGKGFG